MKHRKMIRKILTLLCAAVLVTVLSLPTFAMALFVEPPTGKSVALEVEPNASVDEVKAAVFEKTGISAENQILSFDGRVLENGFRLSDYSIQKESILHLTVAEDTEKSDLSVTLTDNGEKDIGVYVKYVDNTEWNTVLTDENGNGTDTLPDGTEVEITGADNAEGRLVIDLITEKDALEWISGVTDGKVKTSKAFHIYYLDESGNIKKADGITVTVKSEDALQNATVYSLNTEGNTTGLEFSQMDGTVTFTVNGDPYYIIGEKVSTAPWHNAQTGDDSHMVLWTVLLIVSACAFAGTAFYGKKKKLLADQTNNK